MRQKHIAHITTLTNWGGIERLLLDFLFSSCNGDLKHILVTTSSSPSLIKLVLEKNISWFQPQNPFRYDPRKINAIGKYLRRKRIDLVHSYNAHGNAWAYLALLITRNSIPLITGERGSIWFVRPPMRWLDRLAQRKARMIITNSNASAFMLMKYYGISSSKIHVIYNGIQRPQCYSRERARSELRIPQGIKVVGSIGRLDSPKDYWTLIDAAALFLKKRHDVMFVIIGGGPQEAFLNDQVIKKGISDRFYFTGWRANARELIAAFDLYVSTSVHESFGNTLIEAAFLEKAVIASDVDGVPEAVVNNVTGILLKPTSPLRKVSCKGASPYPQKVICQGKFQATRSLSPQSLADTINELIDDNEQAERMGRRGRERAEEQFSLNRYIKKLNEIYSNILTV